MLPGRELQNIDTDILSFHLLTFTDELRQLVKLDTSCFNYLLILALVMLQCWVQQVLRLFPGSGSGIWM